MEHKYSLKQVPETWSVYVCVVGDNELFCKMVYQQKCDSPYFQLEPIMQILTITNLQSRISTCPKPDFVQTLLNKAVQ